MYSRLSCTPTWVHLIPTYIHMPCTYAILVHIHAHTYDQEVVMNISTPKSVGSSAGVVPTVVPLY